MAELTTDEADWIKGASDALIAIRAATQTPPDEDQTRAIRLLADAFHNIGMVTGENTMFAHMHTPARLADARVATERLRDSVHRRPTARPSILAKIFQRPNR